MRIVVCVSTLYLVFHAVHTTPIKQTIQVAPVVACSLTLCSLLIAFSKAWQFKVKWFRLKLTDFRILYASMRVLCSLHFHPLPPYQYHHQHHCQGAAAAAFAFASGCFARTFVCLNRYIICFVPCDDIQRADFNSGHLILFVVFQAHPSHTRKLTNASEL